MKIVSSICASFLLVLSSTVFAATPQGKAALEHAKAAVEEGKAGRSAELVKHAGAALEETLSAAITANGAAQKSMNAASEELGEAINHGNLGHAEIATQHAEAALEQIQAANK